MSIPSTSPVSAHLAPDTTISAIVTARPSLARVFEELGINYCCEGKQTLTTACQRRGLDVTATMARLDSAGLVQPQVDVTAMDQIQLADHIVATHHAYLKAELPRLVEMAERVATKHGWRDERLVPMARAVRGLAEEMFSHMHKEELILFPLVREIAAGAGITRSDLAGPITQMETEHEGAHEITAQLRELTDGFTPNAEACNTHRALLAGLAEFEADLLRHVHKENNFLFPRALAAAKAG